MAEKVKVSVIVPVYNVEQYLAECLDSLASQSLPMCTIVPPPFGLCPPL